MKRIIRLENVIAILAIIHIGLARDLRTVTEPKTPEACVSLKASNGDDTNAIQKALESCTKGKAVALSSGIFYSGPLTIPSGVSLLVEKGVTLKALTNPALYDLGANTCGTVNEYGVGCKAFITMLGAKGSGIYGNGTIDGQANVTMTGKNISWWGLSIEALHGSKYQNNPQLVQINNSMDITLYQITLMNSPFYTVAVYETNGFTVWGVTVLAPATARNTDGIDPIGCQNVTIAHCYIATGDDNVAIKALTAPSRHISVLNNHFGHGNALAIGSEVNHGASDVTVSGLTLSGSKIGLHIKSNAFRGGHVTNIFYDNVCIIDVITPIALDMRSTNLAGDRIPVFRNITFSNVYVLTKGRIMMQGFSETDQVEVTLKNVHINKNCTVTEHLAKVTGSLIPDATGTKCGYSGNQ